MRNDHLISLVHKLAMQLRRQGKEVSIDEELAAVSLADAYSSLNGHLDNDDITTIILATLAKDEESETLIKKLLPMLLAQSDSLEKDLIKGVNESHELESYYNAVDRLQYMYEVPKNSRKLKYVANMLAKMGELKDPRIVAKILERRPSIALSVGKERSLAAVRYMSMEKAAEVVRRLIADADSYEEALSIAKAVDPRLLWRVEVKGLVKGSPLEALVRASISLRYSLAYLNDQEPQYLQFAVNEIESTEKSLGKAHEGELKEIARSLLDEAKAIIGVAQGDLGSLASLPLETLVPVIQDLYITAEDQRRRRALERLLDLSLVRTSISSYQGKRITYSATGGRLDLRRSEQKYIRMINNFMTYRSRERVKSFSLLLDVSGSMRTYSSMALAAAASAADGIDTLVLFNDAVKIVKGPLKRQAIIRLLASLRFDGYTNISQAIKASEGSRRAILISDLRQTVKDSEPSETICSFINSGRRLAAITPPSVSEAELSKIRSCGAIVTTVGRQSDVIRAFSEILRKV